MKGIEKGITRNQENKRNRNVKAWFIKEMR
jgi:hypothetical protein